MKLSRKDKPMPEQVKFYVDDDMKARLEDLSERYGIRSVGAIAKAVLDQYLGFWEQAEEAKRVLIAAQQQRAGLEVSQPYTKGRGSKGEAARVRRDAESREEKKRK
jgi:hypothetical protein